MGFFHNKKRNIYKITDNGKQSRQKHMRSQNLIRHTPFFPDEGGFLAGDFPLGDFAGVTGSASFTGSDLRLRSEMLVRNLPPAGVG